MFISDLSIKRPVFASVVSLLLIVFGAVAFIRLPLRKYPDIDPPVVSIETVYPGPRPAAAGDAHHQADRGPHLRRGGHPQRRIRSIDGHSKITIEFEVDRDVDAAANDIRDRVSGILDDFRPKLILLISARPTPMRMSSSGSTWRGNISIMELTDYARRYLVDRISTLGGAARARSAAAWSTPCGSGKQQRTGRPQPDHNGCRKCPAVRKHRAACR